MMNGLPFLVNYVTKVAFQVVHTLTMTIKLKRKSHSPSPFSWDALTPPRAASPNAPEVTGLPSPPTSWLSARDMKIFGAQPLRADIGVVRCADCDKPILRSAILEHISML